MKSKAQITHFVIETMNLYNIDWEVFFPEAEDKPTSRRIFSGKEIDEETLTKLSSIIGLTRDEILNCDKKAAKRMYQKYKYFDLREGYEIAEHIAQYAPGQAEAILVNAIFNLDDSPSRLVPKITTSKKEIEKRLIAYLKDKAQYFPKEYHDGQEIKNLSASYELMFDYLELKELLVSFIEMVEKAKELFFKALRNEISSDEINEYNFLVTVLHLKDAIIRKPMYYQMIELLRSVLINENYESFYDYVTVEKYVDFEPWRCKQFVEDKELAEKYFDVFPTSRRRMFDFGMRVNNFACTFNWSDEVNSDDSSDESEFVELTEEELLDLAMEDFDEPLTDDWIDEIELPYHLVYLPMTDAELGLDITAVKKLKEFCSASGKGGIKIRVQKDQSFFSSDNKAFLQRLSIRQEIISGGLF